MSRSNVRCRGLRCIGLVAALAAAIGVGGCSMDDMFQESGSQRAQTDQPAEVRPESGFGGASTPGSTGSSTRGVRVDVNDRNVYVVRMNPGPAWRSGLPTADQPGYAKHLDTLRRWSAQGIVVLGGPMISDNGTMVVIRAASLADARDLALSDGAVRDGLFVPEVNQMAAQFPGRN